MIAIACDPTSSRSRFDRVARDHGSDAHLLAHLDDDLGHHVAARDLDDAPGEAVRGAERAEVDLRRAVGLRQGRGQERDGVVLAPAVRRARAQAALGRVRERAQDPALVLARLQHAAFPLADRHHVDAQELAQVLLGEVEPQAQGFDGLHRRP